MVAHDGSPAATVWKLRTTPAAVLGMAALCVIVLALPGQTETTKYVNDLLIFLDGAHRIASGQVPNRDFHTALGPLSYYIPAAGYLLTGSFGAAMPVGVGLFILLLAPVMAYVLDSRLSARIALPLAGLLLLVLSVPINLGERVADLSFAMFYNRIGWAVLALLLVMYLPPRRTVPRQLLLDAGCAATLALILLYSKISYGLVALAFLAMALLLSPRQRGWAAAALAIVVAMALVIEAFWRSTAAYVADVLLASEVSGGIRGTPIDWFNTFSMNLTDAVLFALLAGLALWRTRSFRDLLFYSFCAVAGFLLINQNFQNWGMITLFAGGAVAAETLLRADFRRVPGHQRRAAIAAPWLMIAFVLPTAIHCAIALGLHGFLASKRSGESFPLPNFESVRLVDLWSPSDYRFGANYLNSLRNGTQALNDLVADPSRVFVMDFVNPFSAGLGLAPPRGDSSWQHWGRNLNNEHFVPPEELLADVKVVMEPKYPVERWTYDGLKRAYLPYVWDNFDFAGENVDWWVFVARDRPPDQQN